MYMKHQFFCNIVMLHRAFSRNNKQQNEDTYTGDFTNL